MGGVIFISTYKGIRERMKANWYQISLVGSAIPDDSIRLRLKDNTVPGQSYIGRVKSHDSIAIGQLHPKI